MEILLTLIFFIPTVIYCIMLIYVIRRAIRFGENIPERTHKTFILGLVAGTLSLASAIFKMAVYSRGVGSLTAAAFCLLFTFFFKRIVCFFEEDFDKKHQISVESDSKIYGFSQGIDENADFFDEKSRFGGDFTDYDKK